MFAVITVFIAGLMIGRTPGTSLGRSSVHSRSRWRRSRSSCHPLLVLCGTAVGVMVDAGKAGVSNPAEHGFSEILYAFSSAGNNNGSAFAGISANTRVLQHGARHLHALRALLACDTGARARGRPGRGQARPRFLRNPSTAHAAVRPGADRHRHHRRRAYLCAGIGTGPRSSSTCCSLPGPSAQTFERHDDVDRDCKIKRPVPGSSIRT